MHLTLKKKTLCMILPILSHFQSPQGPKRAQSYKRESVWVSNLLGILGLTRNTNAGLLWSKNKHYVLNQ